MKEIHDYMNEQFHPKRFIVRERFKFWSHMTRKPGGSIHELVTRIRQDAVTCDFPSITDPLDEAMRTRFICSINNEAVLKALFKVKDDELTFVKAVQLAIEIEDAAKVAKETVQGRETWLNLETEHPQGTQQELGFNVTELPDLNLLGRSAIKQLGISADTLMGLNTADQQCHAVFEELKPKLKLQEECHKLCARAVPFAIQDLSQAYEAGVKRTVWKRTQFYEYGTPVVPIRKPLREGQNKAQLRVCGDYSVVVNAQLEQHRHPIPSPEKLMQKLSGGYGFTKIDLADAYNQIPLGPESQKRLASSTHQGVLLQMRLTFGISSAPGYFQEIMDQLTCDLPGVAVYLDDILVSGATAQEHLSNLRRLLQRLSDKGLRCRLEKCSFAQPYVEYLGHLLSEGLRKVLRLMLS
ncbi:uncharacterized protein LOC116604056 [Nematostella vectensis]|uniref:uncharacterized protein LOC116604056 n=1 Tax=Nematostella vectensis TaxID=45351 RepID=UPI00207790B2|nr:uncharacterized protein LOC116604056 [Nematostella vectensis]